MWNQIYNPLGNAALSTVAAAVPVVTLLVLIASGKVKAHIAAIIAVILTNWTRSCLHHAGRDVDPCVPVPGSSPEFFPIG
jgi:lactate permease